MFEFHRNIHSEFIIFTEPLRYSASVIANTTHPLVAVSSSNPDQIGARKIFPYF